MTELHPALQRHVWNPLFWLKVWKARHKWIPCERCGFLNECLPYGESVRSNYAALAEYGYRVPDRVLGPEDKRVCIHCCLEMREAHGDQLDPAEWLQQKGLD
jgi:hypothetical protein